MYKASFYYSKSEAIQSIVVSLVVYIGVPVFCFYCHEITVYILCTGIFLIILGYDYFITSRRLPFILKNKAFLYVDEHGITDAIYWGLIAWADIEAIELRKNWTSRSVSASLCITMHSMEKYEQSNVWWIKRSFKRWREGGKAQVQINISYMVKYPTDIYLDADEVYYRYTGRKIINKAL